MAKPKVLTLKVLVHLTGLTKTFQFEDTTTIDVIMKDIRERSNIQVDTTDHGLFVAANERTGKKAFWMQKKAMLKMYSNIMDVTANLIEFKKRLRPLKVILTDGTVKMTMIDDAAAVRDIADAVGEKLGIRAVEEFSLRRVTPEGLSKAPLWLDETRTLHDQDIPQDEPLEFAKRFFFSDDRVDKDDPFTLHLLFDEANKAILTGRYPCSREQAKDFAALQMQLVYKDYQPNVNRTIDRAQFLPMQYRKDDKLIPEIISAHKSLFGMKEQDAKFRYVSQVRSLKTYGITFFECTEKVTGQKKPMKLLIGVTKSKIVKMEFETQKEIKSWPFEHLRRWSGENGVFVLDFGDYADDYMTLLTNEAEALSQILSGYIDIILRQRIDTERVIEEDDSLIATEERLEGAFGLGQMGAIEGFNTPYNPGNVNPQIMHPGQQFSGQVYDPNTSQYATTEGMPEPQETGFGENIPPSHKVNVVDMGTAIKCCRLLGDELGAKKFKFAGAGLPEAEWSKKFEAQKVKLKDDIQDLLAAALQNPGSLNRPDLDNKAKEIATALKEMAQASGALIDLYPDQFPLMDGCKSYADSIGDILDNLMKGVDAPYTLDLPGVLQAAEKIWPGATLLAEAPHLSNYVDKGSNLLMLECIQDARTNLDGVIREITNVSPKLNPSQQRGILQEVGKTAGIKNLALNNLANLVQQIMSPQILDQVHTTSKILIDAKQHLLTKISQAGIPIDQLAALVDYSIGLDNALANLESSCHVAESRSISGSLDVITPAEELLEALGKVNQNLQSPQQLIEGVSQITLMQNTLAGVTKALAIGCPQVLGEQLTGYSTQIAVSTKELMEGARILCKNPNDLTQVKKTQAVIGQLEEQVQQLIADAAAVSALNSLRFHAKSTTASLMKLATASTEAAQNCNNESVRADLLASAKGVQESIANLIAAISNASKDPSNYIAQSDLLESTRHDIPYYSQLVSTAKCAATRSLTDLNKKQKLNHASQETADNLRTLMKAIKDVSDIGGQTEIEEALAEFDSARHDLETAEFFAEQGLLKPIPGQTRQDSQALLKRGCDAAQYTMDALTEAPHEQPIADCIRQIAVGIGQVAIASRTAASTMSDKEAQKQMIGAARELLEDTLNAIQMARSVSIDPDNPDKRAALENGRRKFEGTLGLLGDHACAVDVKDLNLAIDTIQKQKGTLNKNSPNRMAFKDASDALESSTKALQAVVAQLTSVAKTNPANLGTAAKLNATTTTQLLNMCSVAATAAPNSSIADGILAAARAMADAMQSLLSSAKNVATDKTAAALTDLANNQVLVKGAADQLVLSLATTASPDVDLALKKIKGTLSSLELGEINVTPTTRESLLTEFLATAKDMARVTSNLVASAQVSTNTHGQLSKEAAGLVKNLLTAAFTATISDGAEGTSSMNASRIAQGCQSIINNPTDLRKVGNIMNGKINPCAGKIILSAKEFSKGIIDKTDRLTVVNAAQAVITDTNALGQAIRSINPRDIATTEAVATAATSLRDHVWVLEDAMSQLSKETQEERKVEPRIANALVTTSKQVALATHEMIRASAQVAANSDTENVHNDLVKATSDVSQSIQSLAKVCGALNPGVKECQRAIQEIQKASTYLESSNKAALVGGLRPAPGSPPFSQLQGEASALCDQTLKDLNNLMLASTGTSSSLMKAAASAAATLPQFAQKMKNTAAASSDQATQTKMVGVAKQVVDSFIRILMEVQNMSDKDASARLSKTELATQDLIGTLLSELQSGAQIVQDLDALMATVKTNIEELGKPLQAAPPSYSECRQQLSTATSDLVSAMAALTSADKKNSGQMSLAARRVGDVIPGLITAIRGCVVSTKDAEAKQAFVACTKQLGQAVLGAINSTKGIVQGGDPSPLDRAAMATNKVAAEILVAAKKGAIADALIEQALELIRQWITQINTAAVFAQAGQLEEQKAVANMTLNDLQTKVGAASTNLSSAVTALVGCTRSGTPDESLGNSTMAFAQAVEVVAKFSWALAAKMQDTNGQQDILTASKLVAITSQQLILAAKEAHKFPQDTTIKATLQSSQQAVTDRIAKLSTVIQHVAAEAQRCQNELNKYIEQIRALKDTASGYPVSAPVDVIYGCKEVLTAASELIFAQNQLDTIEAGKANFSAVEVLINAAMTVAKGASDKFVGDALMNSCFKASEEVCKLLETAKLSRQDPTTQPKLDAQGEKVTGAINGIVASLRRFPDASTIQLNDNKDLDAQCQQELMKCYQIIEDTIRGIQAPRPSKLQPAEDYDRANATVVEACKAIGSTTMNLLQASLIGQQDKVKRAKLSEGDRYQPDQMLINGLISSAQNVAVCVQEVASATNKSVTLKPEEDTLIASATAVGQATSGLSAKFRDVSAVQTCAKAVAAATNSMVKAAKNYSSIAEGVDARKRMNEMGPSHGGSETDQWVKIIRLERELEQEKKKQAAMAQVKLKANNRKTIMLQGK